MTDRKPMVYGWIAAEQAVARGEVQVGDMMRDRDNTHHWWDGEGWTEARPLACDTCGDKRRVPWMIEVDPHCYQERDEDGMAPCPDCVVLLSVPGVFAAARMVHHTTPAAHSPVPIFIIRPPDIDEQVYRTLARKGIEVGQPASATAIRSESVAAEPREPGRLASLLNARWKWWHGLHGHVSKHRGQATGETFYGCNRGHIARKRR